MKITYNSLFFFILTVFSIANAMEEKTTTIAPIGKIVEFEGAADQVEKEIIQQLVAGNLTNKPISIQIEKQNQEKINQFIDFLTKDPILIHNVVKLSFFHDQLTEVPESIGKLTNLQSLCLQCNRLTTAPEFIKQLPNLQYLGLMGNNLKKVPEFIGQLDHLQTLGLAYNELKKFPACITRLPNLETLNLAHNRLKKIPEITELIKLKELYLQGNQLTTIPECITRLTNLQTLDLAGNNLEKGPEIIKQLAHLQSLRLDETLLDLQMDVIFRNLWLSNSN